jgi:hypothetical protein
MTTAMLSADIIRRTHCRNRIPSSARERISSESFRTARQPFVARTPLSRQGLLRRYGGYVMPDSRLNPLSGLGCLAKDTCGALHEAD